MPNASSSSITPWKYSPRTSSSVAANRRSSDCATIRMAGQQNTDPFAASVIARVREVALKLMSSSLRISLSLFSLISLGRGGAPPLMHLAEGRHSPALHRETHRSLPALNCAFTGREAGFAGEAGRGCVFASVRPVGALVADSCERG